jgi:hypothetical protein
MSFTAIYVFAENTTNVSQQPTQQLSINWMIWIKYEQSKLAHISLINSLKY